jgi:hypothetical protein
MSLSRISVGKENVSYTIHFTHTEFNLLLAFCDQIEMVAQFIQQQIPVSRSQYVGQNVLSTSRCPPVEPSLIFLIERDCSTSLSLAKCRMVGRSKNNRRTIDGFYIFLLHPNFFQLNTIAALKANGPKCLNYVRRIYGSH